jgi:hypothetical protein
MSGGAKTFGIVVALAAAGAVLWYNLWRAETSGAGQWTTIDSYCVDCHNEIDLASGLALDSMSTDSIAEHPEIFETVVRKLRGRMMPPPGQRVPTEAEYEAFTAFIESRLDAAVGAGQGVGVVGLKRLNRTEYGNAIRDLLDLEIDPAALLPQDGQSAGFDNISATLIESPTFVEQYVTAAGVVAAMAIGDPGAKYESTIYRASGDINQSRHAPGMPLGTRGGVEAEHYFPVDGVYRFSIEGLVLGDYTLGLEYRHTVLVLIDDEEVYRRDVGGEADMKRVDQQLATALAELNEPLLNIEVPVTAGWHDVAVTFVARSFAESDEVLFPLMAGGGDGRIMAPRRLEIAGPLTRTGVGPTPSRERVLTCQPETLEDEEACAARIFSRIARRAYRRPVTDADIEAPLRFFAEGRTDGDFEDGIRLGLVAILASPKFLYRAELPPATAAPGSVFALDDLALATRLSFFIWSSIPDDELLALAESGELSRPGMLAAQVERMLTDPKASALVTNFSEQWLRLRDIDRASPDPAMFPLFDRQLRDAYKTELQLFVESILLRDRSVLDLLRAEHTFVNDRLAIHYGLADVQGSRFREATLDDPNRWGLLGKPGIQMITSYANRTAPVLRGAWILEHITGTPPTQPPPDVEALPETVAGGPALTVRQRLEMHRTSPNCNSCHGILDPLGFALENFDAIGRWRDRDLDAGDSIDSSGVLVDGTPVSNARELSEALLARPDLLVQTLTENLLTFALGRPLEYYDMPTVRAIAHQAASDGNRFAAIVEGVVASDAFLMQRTADATDIGEVTANVRD